jgi:predicted metalloprotease
MGDAPYNPIDTLSQGGPYTVRWRNRRESANVEDRRGFGGGGGLAIGGGFGTLIIIVLALLFGVDPRALLNQAPSEPGPNAPSSRPANPEEDEAAQFSRVVLADTEDVWNEIFQRMGRQYHAPTMVLFTDGVQTACGGATSAVGPFYCPADQKVYLDLSFFSELRQRFGAPGDFAQAYVIAHEVGHHVQDELGITQQVDAQRGRMSEVEANRLSVRVELQADFFAGVWAHYEQGKGYLEAGDIEEALRAASAIGDDTLQREARGRVVPDSFTHGTSEQRVRWFRKGFETGDVRQGDTFSAPSL